MVLNLSRLTLFQSLRAFVAITVMAIGSVATAQNSPFAPGWDLDPAASVINFRSVKNEAGKETVETHSFAAFSGTIDSDGVAQIIVKLDSVNTNNDLRNVRMRFLFFETFKFPNATVTTQLTSDMANALSAARTADFTLPIDFSIHGVIRPMNADVTVMLDSNDRISVNSARSLVFNVDDFNLGGSLTKIAETAGGFDIAPSMDISFRLSFVRRGEGNQPNVIVAAADTPPAEVALETKGDFSREECLGRFEILSETGNIYFASGSARLDNESTFVLTSIVDIISRCPGLRILISGHTDHDGAASYNQVLSEKRARSVFQYLSRYGIDAARMHTTGFGQDRPMAPNDSDFNKSRNRRIEFSLYN